MMKLSFVIALCALSASPFVWATSKSECADDSRYSEISREDLTGQIEKKAAFVIDVNSAESFQKQHIPTAIHFGANEKSFASTLPAKKDTLIVAYCGSTACTAWKKAAKAACEQGYTNMYNHTCQSNLSYFATAP